MQPTSIDSLESLHYHACVFSISNTAFTLICELNTDSELTACWADNIAGRESYLAKVTLSAAIPLMALVETFELLGKVMICTLVAIVKASSTLQAEARRINKMLSLLTLMTISTLTIPFVFFKPSLIIDECRLCGLWQEKAHAVATETMRQATPKPWYSSMQSRALQACKEHPGAVAIATLTATATALAMAILFVLSQSSGHDTMLSGRRYFTIAAIAGMALSVSSSHRDVDEDDDPAVTQAKPSRSPERNPRSTISRGPPPWYSLTRLRIYLISKFKGSNPWQLKLSTAVIDFCRRHPKPIMTVTLVAMMIGELVRNLYHISHLPPGSGPTEYQPPVTTGTQPVETFSHYTVGNFTFDETFRIVNGTGDEYLNGDLYRTGTWLNGQLTGAICYENGNPYKIGWFDALGYLIEGRRCDELNLRCQEGIYDADATLIEEKCLEPSLFAHLSCTAP